METNWNDFVNFYDWEFEFICKEQSKDIYFWLKMANLYKDEILEFGCGTGRISLILAKHNFKITAVDSAEKFIHKLIQKNNHKNLTPLVGDMTTFQSEKRFNLIMFPYSTFQYLLTKDQQIKCLLNAKSLLTENGRIILDISPHIAKGDSLTESIKLYSKWNSEMECQVSMYTSYVISDNIQYWEDDYIITDKNSNESYFTHKIALKNTELQEFKDLCSECKLTIEDIYGSFDLKNVSPDSSNILYIIKK
jgi:precorrin-6B methylase 2